VLSAQQHLYISYIGRSIKDNSILPPSAIVDELIDYICSGINLEDSIVRQQLVTQHPLHNFSPQPAGFNNYLAAGNERPAAISDHSALSQNANYPLQEVSIEDFINFFKNPFQHYHNKVLNIFYREDEILLRETEHFELDKLQEWNVKQDLLYLDNGKLDDYIRQGVTKGTLPLKNIAETTLKNIDEELISVKKLVKESMQGHKEELLPVELKVGETLFIGQ